MLHIFNGRLSNTCFSEADGPIFTKLSGLVDRWKARCYGNQLNLEDVRRRRAERPLLFALAFDNRLADRQAAFKKLNGNNPATSCEFCNPLFNNLGVYAVKTRNFCCDYDVI